MADICNVSIQTLRYYDKIDLLKPQYRDPENNYRYYDITQVFRVNIIKYLQYAHLSIAEIRASLKLKDEALIDFWQKQQANISQQIQNLQQTQSLIVGQQQQLRDLLKIKTYPADQIYQRHIPEKHIIQLKPRSDLTPLSYPDEEIGHLDKLLIENKTIGNIQYGFSFPFKSYDSLDKIQYNSMFTQVFTDNVGTAKDMLTTIPGGNYLAIHFKWSRKNYLQYYQKLFNAYNKQFGSINGNVLEISTVDNYEYQDQHSFITELSVKM